MIGCHSAANCPPAPDLPTALRTLGVTFVTGLDNDERTAERYGIQGRPHLVLIGIDGKVAWRGHPADLDFKESVDAALAKVPPPIEFSETGLPRELRAHAKAAADERFDRAIKGLRKVLDDDKTTADVKEAAAGLMEKIETLAARRMAEIERLDKERLYFDVSEQLKASAWLDDLPAHAARLAELEKARDAAAWRDGVKAGERYSRGLGYLRDGNAAKAIRDFDYVIEKFQDTAYADLASAMKKSSR